MLSSSHTFDISLDSSIMLAWISGTFIKFCIAFITFVLLDMDPAILIIAERTTQHYQSNDRVERQAWTANVYMGMAIYIISQSALEILNQNNMNTLNSATTNVSGLNICPNYSRSD